MWNVIQKNVFVVGWWKISSWRFTMIKTQINRSIDEFCKLFQSEFQFEIEIEQSEYY